MTQRPLDRHLQELRRTLALCTGPVARNAVLASSLTSLRGARSQEAVALLRDLVTEPLNGSGDGTLSRLCETLDPWCAAQVLALPGVARLLRSSELARVLTPEVSLGLLTAVRQGSLGPTPFTSSSTGLLQTAFVLAAHGTGGADEVNLHRRSAAETLLLLGASRYPEDLLARSMRLRVVIREVLCDDRDLLRWALGNPGLASLSRRRVVSLATPSAAAALRDDGTLGVQDLREWVTAQKEPGRESALLEALLLPGRSAAAWELQALVPTLAPEVLAEVAGLPAALRAAVRRMLLREENQEADQVLDVLLSEWVGDPAELLPTARRLLA